MIRYAEWDEFKGRTYPEPPYVVETLLSTGLCVFAGRAKEGKSFVMMELAILCGLPTRETRKIFGEYTANTNGVVYYDFENTESRTHRRMSQIQARLRKRGVPDLDPVITFCWDYPALDPKGLAQFEEDLRLYRERGRRIVVIDTMTYVLPPTLKGTNAYHAESDWLKQLKRLAERLDICLVLMTHTSKASTDDPFDSISGSRAMTGIPDTIWLLERVKKNGSTTRQAKLHVAGKEVPRREILLECDEFSWDWRVKDDPHLNYLRRRYGYPD